MYLHFLSPSYGSPLLPLVAIVPLVILIFGVLVAVSPRSLIAPQIALDRWRRRSVLLRLGFNTPLSVVPYSAPADLDLKSPESLYAYWRSDAFWASKWRRAWFWGIGLFLIATALFMLAVVVSEMA